MARRKWLGWFLLLLGVVSTHAASPPVTGTCDEAWSSVEDVPWGLVIVGTLDGHVHALDGASGLSRWSFDSGGAVLRVEGAPGFQNRSTGLLIPSIDGTLFVHEDGKGLQKSPLSVRDLVDASPFTSFDGTIFLGNKLTQLFIVHPGSGEVVYSSTLGSFRAQCMGGAGHGGEEALLIGRSDYVVQALKGIGISDGINFRVGEYSLLYRGRKRNQFPDGDSASDYSIFATEDMIVHAVEPATGDTLWTHPFESPIVCVYSLVRGALQARPIFFRHDLQDITDAIASPARLGSHPVHKERPSTLFIGEFEGQLYAVPNSAQHMSRFAYTSEYSFLSSAYSSFASYGANGFSSFSPSPSPAQQRELSVLRYTPSSGGSHIVAVNPDPSSFAAPEVTASMNVPTVVRNVPPARVTGRYDDPRGQRASRIRIRGPQPAPAGVAMGRDACLSREHFPSCLSGYYAVEERVLPAIEPPHTTHVEPSTRPVIQDPPHVHPLLPPTKPTSAIRSLPAIGFAIVLTALVSFLVSRKYWGYRVSERMKELDAEASQRHKELVAQVKHDLEIRESRTSTAEVQVGELDMSTPNNSDGNNINNINNINNNSSNHNNGNGNDNGTNKRLDEEGKRPSRYSTDFIEVGELGRGGFGKVVRARHRIDGIDYAIKKIHVSNVSEELLEMFVRETKVLANLDHVNVVRYYQSWIEERSELWSDSDEESEDEEEDEDEEDDEEEGDENTEGTLESPCASGAGDTPPGGRSRSSIHEGIENPTNLPGYLESLQISEGKQLCIFIQMQLCMPDTLRSWLSREGRVTDPMTNIRLFRQIVSGLAHIHSKGFIHRDLKPSNIFILTNGDVKIGDFGLSKDHKQYQGQGPRARRVRNELLRRLSGSRSFRHTTGVGSPLYASPEQIEGRRYMEKVDIFSLGVIFFEMFHPPFSTNMERQIVMGNARRRVFPSEMMIKYPKEIALCDQMLSKVPTMRPSAAELLVHPCLHVE